MHPRLLILSCALLCAQLSCKKDPVELAPQEAPVQPANAAEAPPLLAWGTHSAHPARGLLDRCHVLSSQELSVLGEHLMQRHNTPHVDRLRELYRITEDATQDAFERTRRDELLTSRYTAQVEALLDDDLCVEYELALKDYDFKATRFPLVVSALTVLCPDCITWFGERRGPIEPSLRASELRDRVHLIAWQGMPAALSMPRDPAERLLDTLITPIMSTEPAIDLPPSSSPTKPDLVFKNGFARLHHLIIHGEDAQLFGFASAGDSSPSQKAPQDEAHTRPDSETAYLEELADIHHEVRAHHRTRVRVALDLKQATIHPFEGVEVHKLFAQPIAVAMANADGEVFEVWPTISKELTPPAQVLLSDVPEVLDVVCQGSTKRHTRTIMKQGKLVDETSYTCGRCPDLPGITRTGPLELSAHIVHARLHTPWQTGWLVTGHGCVSEDMVHNESIAFHVTTRLDGRLAISGVYPHLPRYCSLLERSPDELDLLLCDTPEGEGPNTYTALVRLESHHRRSHHDLSFFTGPATMPCDGERVGAHVDRASSEDVNGDGILDLVIHLEGEGACPTQTLRYLGTQGSTPNTPLSELFAPDEPTAAFLRHYAF